MRFSKSVAPVRRQNKLMSPLLTTLLALNRQVEVGVVGCTMLDLQP